MAHKLEMYDILHAVVRIRNNVMVHGYSRLIHIDAHPFAAETDCIRNCYITNNRHEDA